MPETIQEKAQAGIESSRGVGVAATRVLNGVMTPATLNRNLTWAQTHNGLYVSRQKASYGRAMPELRYNESMSYEDIAWWMQFIAEGGVTGVSDLGSPAAYSYAFDPDLTTDSVKSATIEFGVTGHIEDYLQCMVDTAQIRIAPDNTTDSAWMLDLGLKSLAIPAAGTFASLTTRVVEDIRAAGTKLYIDDDPVDLGTTQATAWMIDASVSINLMRHFKAFAENTDGASPGKTGRQARTIDAQITVEFDDYDEYDNFLSDEPVLRAVRLYQEGSIIHDAVRKSAALDIVGYWSTWAPAEREGNRTAVMTLQGGMIDSTFANDWKFEVVNDLATLP